MAMRPQAAAHKAMYAEDSHLVQLMKRQHNFKVHRLVAVMHIPDVLQQPL